MKVEAFEYEGGIGFKDVKDFEVKHIFDCGQCFRWNENDDGSYTGVAFKRAVRVYKKDNDVYISGGKIEDKDLWINYFDLERDYGEIKDELSKDEVLKDAIKYGDGIRVLNQEIFETLISYIISANNRIPMIKRSVENIAREYGEKVCLEGKEYYTFPDANTLSKCSVDEISSLGCGFRSEYIVEAAKRIAEGKINLQYIKTLNTDEAQIELMKLKGIGPKVSDCIMLFSMGKYDAFPVDVWVKRVMQYFYLAPDVSLKKIREFGREKFKNKAGFAQEYLFYYARVFKGKEGLTKKECN